MFFFRPGDEADPRFGRPRELDLIQSILVESVELKAPPRVLTLKEQPLDFLEPEQQAEPDQLKDEVKTVINKEIYYINPASSREPRDIG